MASLNDFQSTSFPRRRESISARLRGIRLFARYRSRWIPAFAGMTWMVLCLISSSVLAANTCYSPAEVEAEDILRLHSELMVITVTCRQASDGDSLVPAYTGFTKRHIALLHGAEQTMMRYYDEHGGDSEEKLDHLRTKLANEFGQKIAKMSSQPFCDAYRNKVVTLYGAPAEDIMDEVERMQVSYNTYVKPCLPRTRIVKK